MARIVKMDNNSNWPRIIRCKGVIKVNTGTDQFTDQKCPASFEVSLPTDMTLLKYEGTPPQYDAVAKCPLCGEEHHIDSEGIPEEILKQIPMDTRSGIMSYHD